MFRWGARCAEDFETHEFAQDAETRSCREFQYGRGLFRLQVRQKWFCSTQEPPFLCGSQTPQNMTFPQ